MSLQSDPRDPIEGGISSRMVRLMAIASGLIVANIYYAQPLAGPIVHSLGVSPVWSGLVVTMTQIGYCAGLLLIVPMADLFENRALIARMTALIALALLGAAVSANAPMFFIFAVLIGLLSVSVQILVPFAAHLAPEAVRGRVVGNVMSGLMMGIMLARPLASMVAQLGSWHGIFVISAVAMVVLAMVLNRVLPQRVPSARHSYKGLLLSMGRILLGTRVLQRRAFYHACLFGAFSLFWTVTPLLLAGPRFQMSQAGIAIFALVGVGGSISAPIAGRIADRGWTWPATMVAMLMVAGSFAMTWITPESALLVVLMLAAIVLDAGVAANLVLGQRALFMLPAENRSRLNGLYMAIFFIGGAVGSAAGGWAYAASGWGLASAIGCAFALLAFIVCLTER